MVMIINIQNKNKIYAGSIITNFHNKKMLKEKSPCKCLSIRMIDSVIKANKKYYPQTISEECKYVQEKIKTENCIDEKSEISESDSDCNDEIESGINNDECFVKNIVCVNDTLLSFYLCQFV